MAIANFFLSKECYGFLIKIDGFLVFAKLSIGIAKIKKRLPFAIAIANFFKYLQRLLIKIQHFLILF